MGKIAFVFPGQGAQHSGMGQQLFESSPAAKAVFDCADRLRPGTSEQCFSGTAEELSVTENTQPCVYCVDLAAAEALKEAGVIPDMLAGFSLGEIAALTFSGAVSGEDGFRLVSRRAQLMQKATETAETSMVAVLKMEDDAVIALCGEFKQVYPVNFNSPGQIAVSGEKGELELFKTRVKEEGGKIMPLKVSGAFHSPFMAGASVQFADVLKDFSIMSPTIPLYSNVTAQPYANDLKHLLAQQICSPVRWRQIVENMIEAGADTFIEVGPGKVLSGLVSRISSTVRIYHVEDAESLKNTISEVNTGA